MEQALSRRPAVRLRHVLLGLVLVAAAAAAFLVVQWVRPYPLPALPDALTPERAGLAFARELATAEADRTGVPPRGDAAAWQAYRAAMARLRAGDAAGGLAGLIEAVRLDPRNLYYSTALRRELAARQRWDDLQRVWDRFDLSIREIRLQKALSMVDVMVDPALADAGIGKLSIRSERDLTAVLERNPYDWLARYPRGLNNLYWPVGLRRIDKATQDLGFVVAITERLDLREPWMAIGHAAYGDALVKVGRTQEGLRVWRAGLARFPGSAGLQERVDGAADPLEVVRRIRGTDFIKRPAPGVADLSLIWNGSHP